MPNNDMEFNTPLGQPVAREKLVSYVNTDTYDKPVWSAFGLRVSDSSIEYDYSEDTSTDILGNNFTTLNKPKSNQDFTELPLDKSDVGAKHIWNLAVREQNAQALSNQDVLVVHFYAGTDTVIFAERYPSSAITVTRLGGPGGGNLTMDTHVTFGGQRILGSASSNDKDNVTFTPDVT